MTLTSKNHTPSTLQKAPAIDVVIMAAGKGTRMKVLAPKWCTHSLASLCWGMCWLRHAVQARNAVVITGHGAIEVEASCAQLASATADLALNFVRQEPQLGTGHAVQQAVPVLADDGVRIGISTT
ncbi:MAG: hypothetical protein IPI16_22270 [Comamonadaceae bacterium]|nr:hypothetical protein [Comamonadaceae bacterium]